MKRQIIVISTLVTLLLALVPLAHAGKGAMTKEQLYEQRTAPLKKAGIDPESSAALMQALSHHDGFVKYAALDLLRERREKIAIPEVRKLLQSRSLSFQLLACETLAVMEDEPTVWKPVCVAIFTAYANYPRGQMRAAALLARHGDTRGWEVVRDVLLFSDSKMDSAKRGIHSNVPEAAIAARDFVGQEFRTAEGTKVKIDVFDTLCQALTSATEIARVSLLNHLKELATPENLPRLKSLLLLVQGGSSEAEAKWREMLEEIRTLRQREDLNEQERQKLFNAKFPGGLRLSQTDTQQQLTLLIVDMESKAAGN